MIDHLEPSIGVCTHNGGVLNPEGRNGEVPSHTEIHRCARPTVAIGVYIILLGHLL